jgi:hypothetical protein
VKAGKRNDALEFLKKRPQAVLRSARVQTSLAALEEERTQSLYRTLGRAYAGLVADLPAGEALMQRAVAATAPSSLFRPMADAFHARGLALADRVLAEAIRNAKLLLREHNREAAGQALQTASGMVDYASAEMKSEWQNTLRKASQTSLIARFRG